MADQKYQYTLSLYRAIMAAGFDTTPIKEFESRRGVAWSANLKYNGKVIAEASNEGVGGMSRLEAAINPRTTTPDWTSARTLMATCLESLFALPEIQAHLRATELSMVPSHLTEEERQAKIAEISAMTFKVEEEVAADLIAELADIKKRIAALKRVAAKRLAWARAGDELGSNVSVSGADTPENRKACMAKYADEFKDFQGFLGDLLHGL
ncbi:MAG: hypothetical protein O9327_02420 [Polaromonas sp.]|nr:hypothetical protein [Polaromonas sp.]